MVIIVIIFSSFLVGLVFMVLGVLWCGNLVLFVLFLVVGGFFVGIGYLFWSGVFMVLIGYFLGLDVLCIGIDLYW